MLHVVLVFTVALLGAAPASAQIEQLLKGLERFKDLRTGVPGEPSDAKIASGLREALQVGAQNTVNLTGRLDGYLKNEAIKVPMPEQLRSLEKTLRAVGLGARVDEFVVSMNRAAERAAPFAKDIFWNAIGDMSFEDARKILGGGETAATEYFKAKTSDQLVAAFRPVVEAATNDVGVTRRYKELVARARLLAFFGGDDFDLDQYVVSKGLDGLFHVLADEERKIRTNPDARVTALLQEVFGAR